MGDMGESPGPPAAFPVHGACAGPANVVSRVLCGKSQMTLQNTRCEATGHTSLVDTLLLTLLVPPIASE